MRPMTRQPNGKPGAPPALRPGSEAGFTFIELVMVIVMIGILASILVQKFINIAETTEITAEDTTVDLLRANLINTLGEQMIKGQAAVFPQNPFDNLSKVPTGFDRFRTTKPTGDPTDDNAWVFIRGGQATTSTQITPQQAGTTLPTFRVDGFIYHQRRDHTVVRWAYDSSTGVISKKFIEKPSDLKRQQDINAQARQDIIQDQQLQKTR